MPDGFTRYSHRNATGSSSGAPPGDEQENGHKQRADYRIHGAVALVIGENPPIPETRAEPFRAASPRRD
jgi:hypothetical protein